MNTEQIVNNEAQNDYSTAHLYLNKDSNTWMAYGYSACTFRMLIKARKIDCIRGYSTTLQMPYTAISREALKQLSESLGILIADDAEYCVIQAGEEFDVNDYKRWIYKLQEELKVDGGFTIQTHISHLVPKDKFIKDGMNAVSRNSKRLFDLFASVIVMIVFSPLFVICWILVRREDRGPAIFRQERIGRFGRPFYILKFRTMRMDAESMGPQLSHGGGDDDPRLTKIGKFLRAHHLDELPQLWNVFKGDMSFVGPRPERKFYIDQIMEHDRRYEYLYQIRPGVTSYATFYNGYTDTMEKMLRRLEYDLYYLGHRSWIFDIKILLKTFFSIIGGKKF